MSNLARSEAGAVGSLWRYPVKSMRGEELSESLIGEQGLLGDRAYALVDGADGKVATAKNPKKWPNLFAFQATLADGGGPALRPPPRSLPTGGWDRAGRPISIRCSRRSSAGPSRWRPRSRNGWPRAARPLPRRRAARPKGTAPTLGGP